MPRLVKRYGNRKLYDTQESKYVTLEDIATFVKAGEEVKVIDNDSGDELTAVTFAQIILEGERRKTALLPLPILRTIIQQGEAALQDLAERVDKGRETIASIGEKAGRRVQELVNRGVPSKSLLDEMLARPQKRLEALQKGIDERFRQSIERLSSIPAQVQSEVARVEKAIRRLEEQLAKLRPERDRKGASKDGGE